MKVKAQITMFVTGNSALLFKLNRIKKSISELQSKEIIKDSNSKIRTKTSKESKEKESWKMDRFKDMSNSNSNSNSYQEFTPEP